MWRKKYGHDILCDVTDKLGSLIGYEPHCGSRGSLLQEKNSQRRSRKKQGIKKRVTKIYARAIFLTYRKLAMCLFVFVSPPQVWWWLHCGRSADYLQLLDSTSLRRRLSLCFFYQNNKIIKKRQRDFTCGLEGVWVSSVVRTAINDYTITERSRQTTTLLLAQQIPTARMP